MLKEFDVITKEHYQFIDITRKIEQIVEESGVNEGLVLVFAAHTTVAVLINENEPGLNKDWLKVFKKMTSGLNLSHNQIDNNAEAHLAAGLIGSEKTLIVRDGKLIQGTWQRVFLVELDGPRTRKVMVKIIGNS